MQIRISEVTMHYWKCKYALVKQIHISKAKTHDRKCKYASLPSSVYS